jgi:ankyrin repeat protein
MINILPCFPFSYNMSDCHKNIYDCIQEDAVETLSRLVPSSHDVPHPISILGRTIWEECIRYSSVKCMEFLIERKVELKTYLRYYPEDADESLLHVAASHKSPTILQILIREGGNVNELDLFGATPLHYATWNETKECVEMLIEHGAVMDIKDNQDNTCMDYIELASEDFQLWMKQVKEGMDACDVKEPSC